jgi:hypothetical protein
MNLSWKATRQRSEFVDNRTVNIKLNQETDIFSSKKVKMSWSMTLRNVLCLHSFIYIPCFISCHLCSWKKVNNHFAFQTWNEMRAKGSFHRLELKFIIMKVLQARLCAILLLESFYSWLDSQKWLIGTKLLGEN